jgi:serine/threonine protein kinase
LSLECRIHLGQRLLQAVNALHKARISHRDIKPENVLVNVQTCDLRIIDFGLAIVDDGRQHDFAGTITWSGPRIFSKCVMHNGHVVQCGKYSFHDFAKNDLWGAYLIVSQLVDNKYVNHLHNQLGERPSLQDTVDAMYSFFSTNTEKHWENTLLRTIDRDINKHNKQTRAYKQKKWFFDTLGIDDTVTDLKIIRKAYHNIILKYHPDKTVHLAPQQKKQHQQIFKRLNQYYTKMYRT